MKKKHNIPQQSLIGKKNFLIKRLKPFIDREQLDERPHRHNFQEIIYIKSGRGIHTIDDKKYSLKQRTFYLIGKGQVHEFLEGENLNGFLIRFMDNFLPPAGLNTQNSLNSTLLGSIIKTNELTIPHPEVRHYQSLLESLQYEYLDNEQLYAKDQIIQFLLLALLAKLERRVRSLSMETIGQTIDREKKIFHSYLLLIEENYKTNHEIAYYYSQLLVDKRKLANICKKFSKKTPKQILNERLMVEAKRLLMYTVNSSKEIAFDLGYDDPAYFSRFFKKHVGLSPREFKIDMMKE